jgi:hypothetical protein
VEVGVAFDGAVFLMEHAASGRNGGIEVVDGFEVLVDERFVDERPEALGRLQFRAAWRLIEEPDAVWPPPLAQARVAARWFVLARCPFVPR